MSIVDASNAPHIFAVSEPAVQVSADRASMEGMAVLSWHDEGVAWQVVVLEGKSRIPWVRPFNLSSTETSVIRRKALGRAASVRFTNRTVGDLTVVSAVDPTLSGGVVADPTTLLRFVCSEGNTAVFLCPGRQVVIGSQSKIKRFAEECSEPYEILPINEVHDIPWV